MVRASSSGATCGLARRLLAMLYDALVVTGLLLIATALASPFDQGNQQALRDPWFTLYLLGVWFAYLAVSWLRGGMTVGMRAWQIQLRREDGGPVTWKACLLRFAVSLLAAASFGLGFLWALFDPEQRAWHDMASKTRLYRSAVDSDGAP
jgi:uncharacterized RDD family membrane protein YckC